ncbi:MAG: hypothetical protein OXU20_30580 [Myxococcales bacterium]|nr:hypothetical protein [Myxococcales bacterium]MDD9970815.1 hypothetical protein [Myxococcales bacterium]
MFRRFWMGAGSALWALFLGACFSSVSDVGSKAVEDRPGKRSDSDGGVASRGSAAEGGLGSRAIAGGRLDAGGRGDPPTVRPAVGDAGGSEELDSVCSRQGEVATIDKLDLLLVVDDSFSMQEEQEALRRELPALIRTLATGVRRDGSTFPPAKDLHLAVVSTDMGLPRVNGIMRCDGLGDDGRMIDQPRTSDERCQTEANPSPFLSYREGDISPDQVAMELGCIAALGTEGCGYEQQLEAGLKALWPAVDIDPTTGQQWVDPNTGAPSNRIQFLGDGTGFGTTGHGDGVNAGFLRKDPKDGLSLLAIVVVTDEDDCSSVTTGHFVPSRNLPPGSPYEDQGQNLRCFLNPLNLYSVHRYVEGFKALRPGYEQLVVFAAIAGVPPDLVAPNALGKVDFADADDRDAFYTRILDDPRMEERVDPTSLEDGNVDTDYLMPSCEGDGSATSRAFPPRRIVEVAKGFGENGIVQSICQENFELALGAITNVISRGLDRHCGPM